MWRKWKCPVPHQILKNSSAFYEKSRCYIRLFLEKFWFQKVIIIWCFQNFFNKWNLFPIIFKSLEKICLVLKGKQFFKKHFCPFEAFSKIWKFIILCVHSQLSFSKFITFWNNIKLLRCLVLPLKKTWNLKLGLVEENFWVFSQRLKSFLSQKLTPSLVRPNNYNFAS